MVQLGRKSHGSDPVQQRTVLVVEDDSATRDRIANIISSSSLFELLGPASDYTEAAHLIGTRNPDVLLTDLQLPDGNGIDLIRSLSPESTKALVLTVMGDESSVIEAITAGASGYLLKDDDSDDVLKSVSQLLDGQAPLSPSIARYLIKHFASTDSYHEQKIEKSNNILTKRENDVLNLVAKGYLYSEIADVLTLSVHTVASHVKNIYKKLDVNSRGEAVFEASQMGLLSKLT